MNEIISEAVAVLKTIYEYQVGSQYFIVDDTNVDDENIQWLLDETIRYYTHKKAPSRYLLLQERFLNLMLKLSKDERLLVLKLAR